MKKTGLYTILLSMLLLLLISACGLLTAETPGATQSPDSLYTQAAQTVQAQFTQEAIETLVAQPTQVASSPTPVATALPTATELPSPTPLPTATQVLPTPLPPTATPVLRPCNQAQFVRDVTVVDGTIFAPGIEFSKVWRLQNSGTCTWDASYSLVYVSGDRMKGTRTIPLKSTVRPGEVVDLSVDLIAPANQGHYRGYWMLSDEDGNRFGLGQDSAQAFWVDIKVMAPNENFAYDFAINLCTATWRSSAGSLLCPSNTSSGDGSVAYLSNPVFEGGRHENESTLWVRPEEVRGGWISGVYPPYKVNDGDHFLAEVGCLNDSQGCEVTFSLDYQISGGSLKNLGKWYETYDGTTTVIDIDLSSLAGKTVQFVLSTTNDGKPGKANAFWFVPSIRLVQPTPPPPNTDENPAVHAALMKVASDSGISISQLTVKSVEVVQWSDSCLGVYNPGKLCTSVIIPGYKVILNSGSQQFEAHTNQDGSTVFWFEP